MSPYCFLPYKGFCLGWRTLAQDTAGCSWGGVMRLMVINVDWWPLWLNSSSTHSNRFRSEHVVSQILPRTLPLLPGYCTNNTSSQVTLQFSPEPWGADWSLSSAQRGAFSIAPTPNTVGSALGNLWLKLSSCGSSWYQQGARHSVSRSLCPIHAFFWDLCINMDISHISPVAQMPENHFPFCASDLWTQFLSFFILRTRNNLFLKHQDSNPDCAVTLCASSCGEKSRCYPAQKTPTIIFYSCLWYKNVYQMWGEFYFVCVW